MIDVTPRSVRVTCNGKVVVDWQGNSSQLLISSFDHHAACKTTPRALSVLGWKCRFRISKLTYTAIANPTSTISSPVDHAAERAAAEVLHANCDLGLRLASDPTKEVVVHRTAKLPSEPFTVVNIHIPHRATLPADFSATFMATVAKLPGLEKLYSQPGPGYGLSAADFEKLGELPLAATLTHLGLNNALVLPALPVLKKMPRLKSVNLIGQTTDDATLDQLAELSGLEKLDLFQLGGDNGGYRITQRGLVALSKLRLQQLIFDDAKNIGPKWTGHFSLFAEMPNLSRLAMNMEGIGPQDLKDLIQCKQLKQLDITPYQNARADLAEFQRARPDVELLIGGAKVSLAISKIEKVSPAVGETIDVLPLLVPKTHSRNGAWQMKDGSLHSPSPGEMMTLELPIEPAASYRIEAVAERLAGQDTLSLALPVGDAETMLSFEGHRKALSGLEHLAGKSLAEQATPYNQPVFTAGKPTGIVIEVAPGKVLATCDAKTVVDWKGDSSELSIYEAARRRMQGAPRSLLLSTWESHYRITKLTYTALAK